MNINEYAKQGKKQNKNQCAYSASALANLSDSTVEGHKKCLNSTVNATLLKKCSQAETETVCLLH